jgi:hypothetical protein
MTSWSCLFFVVQAARLDVLIRRAACTTKSKLGCDLFAVRIDPVPFASDNTPNGVPRPMLIRRLLPVLLVLLQSGLAAAHGHSHPNCDRHPDTPHIHLCELLALVTDADHKSHDGSEDDHDSDAVELSDVLSAAAPPSVEFLTLDLSSVAVGPPVPVSADPAPFPIGLPPSTAGPQPPLYITHCSLTI